MTSKPPKTLAQMAAEATGGAPLQIAGKPAAVCPHCGAGMFVDGVNRTEHEIVRYVQCRNKKCGRRFMTKQPPAKIIREITSNDNSASGRERLTLIRDSA